MQPSVRENPAAASEDPSSTTTVVSRRQSPMEHRAGDVVAGKYRLNRVLGLGAMGEVWSATHEELKNEVAIKFLLARQEANPEVAAGVLARFRFEAQVSARLGAKTRNIVAVYDTGSHRGVPFLVMEYVEGKTLEALIDEQGAIAPAMLADILDQACDALSVAHEMGFLHRDIKPANLMLTEAAGGALTVKIADFGVAKSLEVAEATRTASSIDRPKETATGLLVGSPAYMSPEQVHNEARPDPRSDLWALGALAYESLTGCQPFTGKTLADLFITITTREPLRPSVHRPSLSQAIDDWFQQALAKQPEMRFQTAKQMAQAFRAALAVSPPQRRPSQVVGAAAALAALAAAIGLALLLAADEAPPVDPRPAEPPADATATTTAAPAKAATAALPIEPPAIEPAIEEDPTGNGAPTRAPARPPSPSAAPIPDAPIEAPAASTPAAPAQPPPVIPNTTPTRPRPPKEIDPSEIQ